MSHHKKRNRLAILGLFSIILVVSVALLAVMFLQKSVSEVSFDTRKEAMVDSGLVELDTYPFNQSTLKVKEEQKINLQLNTKDKAVKSVELVFEVIADKGLLSKDKIKFTGTIPTEFKVSKQEITESLCEKNCFTVTLLLELKDGATTFKTHDQMKTISQLSFTPQKEGSLKIKISQDSTAVEQESSTDVLQKPSVLDFQYYVTNNGIDRSQCYYEYTDWGDCKNGWQTRQYSTQPDKCYWHEKETLKELSRKCTDNDVVNADNKYFYLYSNDKCLNQPSTGESLYIIWDDDKYEDVTYIDVSDSPNFNDFYHKKVKGNIDQTKDDWIMVNAKGFTDATGNKGPLSFEPNTEYFFRLYSTDNDGQHISSVRYYITYCSGNQSVYKNCNDACGENSDQSKSCAPGMTCYEGTCRNATNPTNSLCLATPGVRSSDLSCNQYCADSNDCESGLTCFWNRCRDTQNLESSSCESLATTINKGGTTYSTNSITKTYTDKSGKTVLLPSEAYDLTTYGCNQGCNSNRDCDADMRCYKGKCRLADNPEAIACVAETTNQESSSSAGVIKEKISTTPTATPTINKTAETKTILQNGLNKFLSSFSWQWLAIAGVILLIAVALIVISITRAKKDPWENSFKVNPEDNAPEEKETIKIPEDKPTQI